MSYSPEEVDPSNIPEECKEQKECKEGKEEQHEPTAVEGKEEEEPINERFIQNNLELAQEIKGEGAALFKGEQYWQAIKKYQQALSFTPKEDLKLRAILYSNIAICHSKLDSLKPALAYCQKAIKQDPTYSKAQYNLAIYYEKNDELEEALTQNKKLFEMYPTDYKLIVKIKELEKAIEEKTEKQKKEVIDGLKNIGNSVLGYFGLSLDNFKLEQGTNGGYNVSFKQ